MINSNIATAPGVERVFPPHSSLLDVRTDANALPITLKLYGRFIDVKEVVERWHMQVEWGRGVAGPDGECVVVGTLGART